MRSGTSLGRAWLVVASLLVLGCAVTPARHAAVPATPPPAPRLFPVTDSDRDGVLDALDACPTLPGVASPIILLNGCPPPGYYDDGFGPKDRDGDGIEAELDRCPEDPGTAEWSGCPGPPDADADGIPDAADACPHDAGVARTAAPTNGCPDAWVDGDQVRIAEGLSFASGSADLLDPSGTTLDGLAALLRARTEFSRVRVEGHTDSRGGAIMNRRLGARRAARVVSLLVARGVASERLEAAGIGPDRPLDTNETEAGLATNRRVEFHVVGGPASDAAAPVAAAPVAPAAPATTPAPPSPAATLSFPDDPSGL